MVEIQRENEEESDKIVKGTEEFQFIPNDGLSLALAADRNSVSININAKVVVC